MNPLYGARLIKSIPALIKGIPALIKGITALIKGITRSRMTRSAASHIIERYLARQQENQDQGAQPPRHTKNELFGAMSRRGEEAMLEAVEKANRHGANAADRLRLHIRDKYEAQ